MGSATRTELACLRSAMGDRRNPVLNGIADLRSAIQRATEARNAFNVATGVAALWTTNSQFRKLEAAYLDTANEVRDALGALGLVPGEINSLGEILT